MNIRSSFENGFLTVFMEGHIDSGNAAEAEERITKAVAEHAGAQVILDAENLEYISSAGLRIILRLKKAQKELSMINVSADVYEVFDMTGFTEMMEIKKAYRRLSVDGCEVIGQGSNGVVYRLDPDTIIKVYRNPNSLPDIHRERELARKAFVLGIPTAIPYDVVRVGETYGSVFELLSAKSFAQIVAANPDLLDKATEDFVTLLKQIHATHVKPGDMPDMKEVAMKWAMDLRTALPEAAYNKLYALIEAVPQTDTMLHGDYHFNNVMVQNCENLLIDMDTLCVGHPVFEFASVYLANVGFGEVDETSTEKFLGLKRELTLKIWDKTLELYFNTTDKDILRGYADKARIIGYTRLLRRTLKREPDNKALIDNCYRNLIELLERTDSLVFDY